MNQSAIVIFESGDRQVEVKLDGETVWLTQAQIAELFGTSTDNISLHLKNVFKDKELNEVATTENFSVVQTEGVRQVQRRLKHYNLDAIICTVDSSKIIHKEVRYQPALTIQSDEFELFLPNWERYHG